MDFQLLSGLLMDKYDSVAKAVSQMKQLKSQTGKRLLEFLSHCSCTGVCEKNHCSLTDVEDCAEIEYKAMVLKPNIAVPYKLSQIREELYAAIIHQLETYFNLDKLKAFQIFDNRRFHAESCSDVEATRLRNNARTNPNINSTVLMPLSQFLNLSARFEHFVINENQTTHSHRHQHQLGDDDELFETICNMYYISNEDCKVLYTEWKSLLAKIMSSGKYVSRNDST
ncbi:unnamed protein product [Orchesella dallaii]|uniref:Uncharacterized protein n=1 Tax=Orchesella dallaii TaxID=48710 RepID=A0ABP1QSR2_9HEXA